MHSTIMVSVHFKSFMKEMAMEKRKKTIIISIVLGIIATVVVVICLCNIHVVHEYKFNTEPNVIDDNPFNYLQNDCSNLVYLYDGVLYFYLDGGSGYSRGLYKIENNRAIKIISFNSDSHEENNSYYNYSEKPLFFINGHLIYSIDCSKEDKNAIVSFNIVDETSKTLSEGAAADLYAEAMKTCFPVLNFISDNTFVYSCDGIYSIFSHKVENIHFSISDSSIKIVDESDEFKNYRDMDRFTFGDFEYYWEDNIWLTQITPEGNNRIAPLAGSRPICEVLDGNAILVSRNGETGFWLIDKKGTVTQLFPSLAGEKKFVAYQVHDTDLYVSVKRYKIYRKLETEEFKNDSEEGLWKINMLTGERQKISNKIYSGMWIYDSSGIIACTYSNDIVLLDFAGKKKCTLVS